MPQLWLWLAFSCLLCAASTTVACGNPACAHVGFFLEDYQCPGLQVLPSKASVEAMRSSGVCLLIAAVLCIAGSLFQSILPFCRSALYLAAACFMGLYSSALFMIHDQFGRFTGNDQFLLIGITFVALLLDRWAPIVVSKGITAHWHIILVDAIAITWLFLSRDRFLLQWNAGIAGVLCGGNWITQRFTTSKGPSYPSMDMV